MDGRLELIACAMEPRLLGPLLGFDLTVGFPVLPENSLQTAFLVGYSREDPGDGILVQRVASLPIGDGAATTGRRNQPDLYTRIGDRHRLAERTAWEPR